MKYLSLTPRDPLVARDGRPFGAGSGTRMKSLDWLSPSVTAGALRTMLGKQNPAAFSEQVVAGLKQIEVAGPLPLWDGTLFLPCPHDFALRAEGSKPRDCFRLRPLPSLNDDYCDLPDARLRPVLLPGTVEEEFKPDVPPSLWSMQKMRGWLLEKAFPPPPAKDDRRKLGPTCGFLDALPRDERTHVKILPGTGAAAEHFLYSTASLAFHEGVTIALRITGADNVGVGGLHPVGGERRLAHWATAAADPWQCPTDISTALTTAGRIRMVLATPALFRSGWKPGWLDDQLEGTPPGTTVKLRLTGVATDRWRAVSGFGLETGLMGPKPIRRTVPAGGVYFFEYVEGDRKTLATTGWLAPVSDLAEDGQDRRDGFGLALWGIWNE